MFRSIGRTAPIALLTAAVAACSSPPHAEPRGPATATLTPSPTATTLAHISTSPPKPATTKPPASTTKRTGPSWSVQEIGNTVSIGTGPAFPASLTGWRLLQGWTETPRAFGGTGWSTLVGPDPAQGYPSTMNGCGTHRFLIRWRSLGKPVLSSASYRSDFDASIPIIEDTLTHHRPALSGWADLNGCQMLSFLLPPPADQDSLSDVVVEVQEWDASA